MMTRHPDILFMTEYIQNVLYFATVRPGKILKNTPDAHFFSIDYELVYENYYSDFGPLNLGCVYKYCKMLSEKMRTCLNKQIIVHYTTIDPKKKANAAFLLGCYGVLYLSLTPKDALKPLTSFGQSYRPFQDATQGDSLYTVTLLDCLLAIKKARQLGFFNFQDFNYEEYERLDKIQGGDLNWIVPGKFLAFIGPVDYSVSLYHPPEMYLEYFKDNNVKIVIRLNKRMYDGKVFDKAGIVHYDLFFPDGSCPPRHILLKFLQISEEAIGALAVHCKAGLGRTGSLIGSYLIKHYRMTAHEAICWMRICRPGSVIGHQQGWLEHLEAWLIKQGNLYRMRTYQDQEKFPVHEFGVYSIAERMLRQRPTVLSASRPLSPVTTYQRQSQSTTIQVSPAKTTKHRDAHNKNSEKEFEWRLRPTNVPPGTKTKKSSKGSLHKEAISMVAPSNSPQQRSSSAAGAGEPRSSHMRSQSRVSHTHEARKSSANSKDIGMNVGLNQITDVSFIEHGRCCSPVHNYLNSHQNPLPTFQTSQGPAIKNLNEAKTYLLRRSVYGQPKDKMLNSTITVTPHYYVHQVKAPVGGPTHPPYKTASTGPPRRRLGLGRSPSPSPHHSPMRMMDQTRATNTPTQGVQSTTRHYTDSRSTFREALSRLKSIPTTRDSSIGAASVGAASLGAQRDAPNAKRAPSVRSDERPLATQGDMLNSIKFQRRFSEALTTGKASESMNINVPVKPKTVGRPDAMVPNKAFSPNYCFSRHKYDPKGVNSTGARFCNSPTRPMSPKARQRSNQ